MRSIHFSPVVVTLLSSSLIYHTTAFASSLTNLELLPNGFSALGDLEVLSVREEDGEEIVHLRQRAPTQGEKCDDENDCIDFSGWTSDGKMSCADGENIFGRSLEKRGRKDAHVCKGVTVGGSNNKEGFLIISPTWRSPEDLEKEWKMVYDGGDPTKPTEAPWFKLSRHDQRWTYSPGKSGTRCYDAEHVLEWDLFSLFLNEHIGTNNDRCPNLIKFFFDREMPKKTLKVRVAKELKKDLSDGAHFEYENKDYDIHAQWSNTITKKPPRIIDWITFQWPGSKTGKPSNPWEYEMVLLVKELNMKKENVWKGKNLFPNPETVDGSKKMKKTKANTLTLEARFDNVKYSDGKQDNWPDNMGKCKAVHMFATLMGLVQYHNNPYIKEVMRAQVTRVANAFEYVETVVLKDAEWKDPSDPKEVQKYKYQGLGKAWVKYMKDLHESKLERLNKALEDKIDVFKEKSGLITKWKRGDFFNIFPRAKGNDPACGKEPDNKLMDKRVKMLIDEYGKMAKADTTLELESTELLWNNADLYNG